MAPDHWSYSGPQARQLAALQLPEQNWSSGSGDFGYFGIIEAGSESRERILRALGLDVLVKKIDGT